MVEWPNEGDTGINGWKTELFLAEGTRAPVLKVLLVCMYVCMYVCSPFTEWGGARGEMSCKAGEYEHCHAGGVPLHCPHTTVYTSGAEALRRLEPAGDGSCQ